MATMPSDQQPVVFGRSDLRSLLAGLLGGILFTSLFWVWLLSPGQGTQAAPPAATDMLPMGALSLSDLGTRQPVGVSGAAGRPRGKPLRNRLVTDEEEPASARVSAPAVRAADDGTSSSGPTAEPGTTHQPRVLDYVLSPGDAAAPPLPLPAVAAMPLPTN